MFCDICKKNGLVQYRVGSAKQKDWIFTCKNCWQEFTKTEGYGVQHFIVLNELLEIEEVLSYDYLIYSSDANFTFVPDFYESWVTQFEEINKEKNIPLLLDTSFWMHRGQYPKKIGNEYNTPQYKNIKWMTLNHGFTQMILNPKN